MENKIIIWIKKSIKEINYKQIKRLSKNVHKSINLNVDGCVILENIK